MSAALALFLGLTASMSSASSSAASSPTVAVLPLAPEKGISNKQAARVHVALREALVRGTLGEAAFVRVLPATKRDGSDAERCRLQAKCLADLAYSRGADLLAGGVLVPSEAGLTARLVVVSPGSGEAALREVDELLGATEKKWPHALDRLVRRAFAPHALAGELRVEGAPPGATILVDGGIQGTLPLDGPITGVVEGEHEVTLLHEGYAPITKRVQVRFDDVTWVDIVLSPTRERVDLDDAAATTEASPTLPLAPLVVAGGGALAVGLGAGLGVAAFLHQLEVERRAQKQLLVFPRDADLLSRGESLAWMANGLYVAGALAIVGAGGWWLLQPGLPSQARGRAE